jgi:hypothetical protein
MKFTPLGVCKFLMMAMITIFLLFLIVVAIVRILASPSQTDNTDVYTNKPNQMIVDIMITDPISINTESIERNQKMIIKKGMNVLVVQGTESDGLYVMDIDDDLVRIDCIKHHLEYVVDKGDVKKKYKWEEHHQVANNVWRKVINSNYNPLTSILLKEDMAEVILFIEGDVTEVVLEFSNIYCVLKIINQSIHPFVKLTAKLQKQEWDLETKKIHHHGVIMNNTLIMY